MMSTIVYLWIVFAFVSGEVIQYCGTQPYYPSKYTCYDGFLCPVIQGERTLKCTNACYLPEAYTCRNGQLGQHKPIKHAFQLTAKNSIPAINGMPVNACGELFNIGGGTCTYCPDFAVGTGACEMATNTTILFSSGGMDVVVPGGQVYFIQTNGAMGFSQAHSIEIPPGAITYDFAAFERGYFEFTQGNGWLACPVTGSPGVYQLFSQLPGLTFSADCVTLNIVTVDVPKYTYGAFQYA